jgi:hypothetical protein
VCVGVCNGEEIPRILLTARKEMKMIRGNTHTQQHVDIVRPFHEFDWSRANGAPRKICHSCFQLFGFLIVREKKGKIKE